MRLLGPVLVAVLALAIAAPASGAALRTGCDASRPATAYLPGGHGVAPQPKARPVPCLSVIDQRTSESATVAVTRSGRVLYAPLVENDYPAPADDRGPALVSASDDGGAHWQTLDSGSPDHILDVPPWMDRDPDTGRIWFASVLPPLCGAEISWSDDDGRTWQTNPVVGCPGMGSMRILEGPPPAGGAKPSGYPHVVYYCANASDLTASNLWCYRSLDGGHSFTFTGSFADPPPQSGCNTQHPARPGTVGPNGYLYFPIYECGQLSVAISRDEGASWDYVPVAKANVQDLYISSMATDRAGNVYLAWIAGSGAGGSTTSAPVGPNTSSEGILGQGLPFLSISRDQGRSWSPPTSVAPPGLKNGRHIAIAAEGTGRVAISLLANTDGSPNLDGWVLQSDDALAPNARWWGSSLNDPATPLINANDSETFGDRLFNFTDTFAPSGEAWAAFHCAKTAACAGKRIGVVGRLTAPRPAPPCVDARKFRFRLHHAPHARVVRVAVFLNGRRILSRRGHDLTSVTIRRLPLGVFRLRIVSTQSTGSRIDSTRTYTGCRKTRPRNRGRHHR